MMMLVTMLITVMLMMLLMMTISDKFIVKHGGAYRGIHGPTKPTVGNRMVHDVSAAVSHAFKVGFQEGIAGIASARWMWT